MKSLKRGVLIGFLSLCLILPVVHAQNMYVNDSMRITVRTGPGNDRKIISLIGSGQPVEVLETGTDWTMVRLPNGKEGWVLSRFLTTEEPSDIVLERLKQKHSELMVQSASLLEENTTLKEERQRLQSSLSGTEEKLTRIDGEFEALKKESTDFLKLKASHTKISAQLSELTQKSDQLEEELKVMHRNQNIKWFLSGAGVLFIGFIIGYSTKRQRRRSSLL